MTIIVSGGDTSNPPPPQAQPPPKDTSPLLTKDTDMGAPPAYNQYGGQPSQAPPPPSQQQQWNPHGPQQPIYIHHHPNQGDAGKRACKRFTGAFIVALLVWMLMSFLAASFNDVILNGHGFGRWDSFTPHWERHGNWDLVNDKCDMDWDSRALSSTGQAFWSDIEIPEIDIDIPDIEIDVPDMMARAPYSSNLSFDLNLDASSHLLVSDNTWGDVTFVQGDTKGDKITVKVTAYYWRRDVWNRARVCKITDGKGGEGIGFSVPRYRTWWNWPRREDQVSFSVTVYFPAPKSGRSPNYVNAFETDLSIFRHEIRRLTDNVHFGSLKLRTSNARITTEDKAHDIAVTGDNLNFRTSNGGITAFVSGPEIDIRSSNGRIGGTYISNDTLIIQTSNGGIDVNAHLQYTGKKTTKEYPYAELKTSNARITSNIYLENPGKNSGGGFEVFTSTSNGAIDLSFPSSPHTSFLRLTSRTSNARQVVRLNKAYEGTFDVSTSSYIGVPEVIRESSDVEDPSGKGRLRTGSGTNGKGYARGRVSWGSWKEGTKHYGSVTVRSSNAKPTLII